MAETYYSRKKIFYEANQKYLKEDRPILSAANVDQ